MKFVHHMIQTSQC